MQNYLNILEEKGIETSQTSKAIQKLIDIHEKRIATYNQLNELIENDQIEEYEIDETKEKLENLAEIINDSDKDLCKKLNKFNLEKYAQNLEKLSNATAARGNKKKTTSTQPVVAAVITTTAPPAQGVATIATQAPAQAAQGIQIPSATIDGKKVEIKEEKTKKIGDKKSNAGGIILGLGLGILTAVGIGVAINNNNK